MSSAWIGKAALLPHFCRADQLDLIHVQRVVPLVRGTRTVLHLHDAIHVTHPSLFPPWKRELYKRVFRWSGRRATHVITPTECSKQDLVRYYLIDPGKISVLENGVDAEGFALRVGEEGKRKVRERFGLTSPYVVYFGALERTKNIHLLLKAFCQFLASFPDYRLVIAGRSTSEAKTGYGEELRSLVGSLQIGHSVTFSGYVDASELPNLIAGARMLAFPSEAEGFGFPPLEALACGTLAVSADTPVSREVYGDAVLRADPNNPVEFSQQMEKLALDEGLRDQLFQAGRRQLQLYRWDNVGRKLLDIYRQVAAATRHAKLEIE